MIGKYFIKKYNKIKLIFIIMIFFSMMITSFFQPTNANRICEKLNQNDVLFDDNAMHISNQKNGEIVEWVELMRTGEYENEKSFINIPINLSQKPYFSQDNDNSWTGNATVIEFHGIGIALTFSDFPVKQIPGIIPVVLLFGVFKINELKEGSFTFQFKGLVRGLIVGFAGYMGLKISPGVYGPFILGIGYAQFCHWEKIV